MELEEAKERLNRFKTIKVMYGNTFAMTTEQLEQTQTAINILLQELDNSIPKAKVEKKIEKLKHKDFIKLQVCYKHDNEALKQIEVLQELLEE